MLWRMNGILDVFIVLLLRMSWLVSVVTDAAAFDDEMMPLMLMFWPTPTPLVIIMVFGFGATPPPPPPPVLLELRRDDPTMGEAVGPLLPLP